MISEIETGRRVPSITTYGRLRRGLGLDAPAAILVRSSEPTDAREVQLVRLAFCLWASRGKARITELATALGVSTATIREQLALLGSHLAAFGLTATEDGVEVRLMPLRVVAGLAERWDQLAVQERRVALSDEAMAVLAFLGWREGATRHDVESFRGEDSETLLARLVDVELLARTRDRAGRRPNRYRLTTVALAALGVASVEELRAKMRPLLGVTAAVADGLVPNAETRQRDPSSDALGQGPGIAQRPSSWTPAT